MLVDQTPKKLKDTYTKSNNMKIVIISDLYIGNKNVNIDLINDFLSHLECDQLILLGDVWDFWTCSPKKLKMQYKKTINLFEKLSKKISIYHILGDHDAKYNKNPVISSRILTSASIELTNPDGRKIIAIHGHQFDDIFTRWFNKPLTIFNNWLYSLFKIPYHELYDKKAARKLQIKSCRLFKHSGYNMVITGHTCCPEFVPSNGDLIDYVNCGDWKIHNTYIEITNDGMCLRTYKKSS